MTAEEAIAHCKAYLPDTDIKQYVINQLERGIEKRPWKQADDDNCIYYHWECPTCGARQSLHGSLTYCMSCGQALDWTE